MDNPAFIRAINFILTYEGELSTDANDPGNWTGGKCGLGELKCTKYGISAATYPTMDIANMGRDQAINVYWRDYWCKINGDSLPPRVAAVVLDSAINQGTETAVKLLQRALGFDDAATDGVAGPHTIAAARGVDQDELVPLYLALRAIRYSKAKPADFDRYGKGWFVRLFKACQDGCRA